MCCFSGKVERVEATKIFARMTAPGRQVLVYQMKIDAEAAVAMILPIPTPAGTADDALRFISLEKYPEVFVHLDKVFPVSGAIPLFDDDALALKRPLAVQQVGAFDASFVPSLADFARLDPRFRVPPGTLDKVPEYADWGFAVFQLAATKGITDVHPMAFEFPTRSTQRLFFPTVHVHDGVLHPEAMFAHALYGQGVAEPAWWSAGRKLRTVIDEKRAEGVFDLDDTVSVRSIFGKQSNRDVWATLRS